MLKKLMTAMTAGLALALAYSDFATADMATVVDPPSNIRTNPNGEIICSVRSVKPINVYGYSNGWYKTDVCGETGYIHQSQIRFNQSTPPGTSRAGVATVFAPPSNIRTSPNGEIICSIRAVKTINIYGYRNGWYKTDACGESGYINESQVRF